MEIGVAHTHITTFGGVCTRCRWGEGGLLLTLTLTQSTEIHVINYSLL